MGSPISHVKITYYKNIGYLLSVPENDVYKTVKVPIDQTIVKNLEGRILQITALEYSLLEPFNDALDYFNDVQKATYDVGYDNTSDVSGVLQNFSNKEITFTPPGLTTSEKPITFDWS